jgi:hypothetical protein
MSCLFKGELAYRTQGASSGCLAGLCLEVITISAGSKTGDVMSTFISPLMSCVPTATLRIAPA